MADQDASGYDHHRWQNPATLLRTQKRRSTSKKGTMPFVWTLRLGPGMVNIFHREIELIFVMLGIAAIFGAAIGQYPQELYLL
jgi:hypothetical protein